MLNLDAVMPIVHAALTPFNAFAHSVKFKSKQPG